MSAHPLNLGTLLQSYREPPAGLSLEWDRVYKALAGPALVAATFRGQVDGEQRGTRELFVAWRDILRRNQDGASAVLQYLRPNSPRTWRAGLAIHAAVNPITVILTAAISFLEHPHPTKDGPEATAIGFREAICARLNEFNAIPLLDELVAASVSDCVAQRALASGVGTATPASAIRNSVVARKKSRRRRSARNEPRPLTDRQRQAVELYGESNGDFGQIGSIMGGISRQAARKHVQAGLRKLGKHFTSKPRKQSVPTDARGQDTLADFDPRMHPKNRTKR
jgi:hypothetical protein